MDSLHNTRTILKIFSTPSLGRTGAAGACPGASLGKKRGGAQGRQMAPANLKILP